MATYHYRVIKTSWGISVTVEGDVSVKNLGHASAEGGRWSLSWIGRVALTPVDLAAVERGLVLAAATMPSQFGGIELVLRGISYHAADYQPEGLTCAVLGLVCSALGWPVPVVPVEYEPASRRYVFRFPEAADPSRDDPAK